MSYVIPPVVFSALLLLSENESTVAGRGHCKKAKKGGQIWERAGVVVGYGNPGEVERRHGRFVVDIEDGINEEL